MDLLGFLAEFIEPRRLGPPVVPALELAERRAPPQRQRFTADVSGPIVLTKGEQLRAPSDHPLEAVRVDIIRRDRQPVPRR